MLNRRTLFGAAATLGAIFSSLVKSRKASASERFEFDLEPRGSIGKLERLATLDLESRDDFLTGHRAWYISKARPAQIKRFNALLEDAGIDPADESTSLEKIFEITDGDPIIGTEARARTSVHDLMHKNFVHEFESHADQYLKEMEAFDNIGPGTLELNPDMDLPEYTKYEIHTQPGGYGGNPFSGHIYHYSTNNFYRGRNMLNYQDELHTKVASQVPIPKDEQVNRILDVGCGIGQLAVGLKERFPSAEVWGIDVAAPMIRYGHMRAADLGTDVHFAQRLAEDTQFPDNHFDVVASYILHHELPKAVSEKIAAEVARILRPGGTFLPVDFLTGNAGNARARQGAYAKYMVWKDHRWNEEVWRNEYSQLDFPKALRDAGLEVTEKGPPAWHHRNNLMAVKPV